MLRPSLPRDRHRAKGGVLHFAFLCVLGAASTGCADVASKIIDDIIFAILAGIVLLGFLLGASIVAIFHVVFAARLKDGRPVDAFRRIGYAWCALSALGLVSAFVLTSHFPHGRAGILFATPLVTLVVGAVAFWTSRRATVLPIPRYTILVTVLAALSPFVLALGTFGYGAAKGSIEDARRERSRAQQEEESAAKGREEIKQRTARRKAEREQERQARLRDCDAWTEDLAAAKTAPGPYFGGAREARIVNEITRRSLSRDHLDHFSEEIPCLDDVRVPNYAKADVVAKAYAAALLSPSLWTFSTDVRGSARTLAPRLSFALESDAAKSFATMVEGLVRASAKASADELRASYARCYLARYLLAKSQAPPMPLCEAVLRRVTQEDMPACTRWVADLATVQGDTYEATMFTNPTLREQASALARRRLPHTTFIDFPTWKPPCTDIYTESLRSDPTIEAAFVEMWMAPDAWRWIHAPPEFVVEKVRQHPRVPEPVARRFAKHIDELAGEALSGVGAGTVSGYCEVARPYLALDPSLKNCQTLSGE